MRAALADLHVDWVLEAPLRAKRPFFSGESAATLFP